MYALNLWPALCRCCDDGVIVIEIEIDNSAAKRALRGVATGRRNYLFAGADGERGRRHLLADCTAKLNGNDPEAWLHDMLAHIADHPIKLAVELLPGISPGNRPVPEVYMPLPSRMRLYRRN